MLKQDQKDGGTIITSVVLTTHRREVVGRPMPSNSSYESSEWLV